VTRLRSGPAHVPFSLTTRTLLFVPSFLCSLQTLCLLRILMALQVPAFLADAGVTDPGTSFALGPAYSGSPMHFHASSWNTLVYGAKLWWLLPPEQAVFSRQVSWL